MVDTSVVNFAIFELSKQCFKFLNFLVKYYIFLFCIFCICSLVSAGWSYLSCLLISSFFWYGLFKILHSLLHCNQRILCCTVWNSFLLIFQYAALQFPFLFAVRSFNVSFAFCNVIYWTICNTVFPLLSTPKNSSKFSGKINYIRINLFFNARFWSNNTAQFDFFV